MPGIGQAFLGMPDIETLDIITINCSSTDTKEAEGAKNHKTKTANCWESTSEEHYINMRKEADTPEKCCTYTDSISKFENNDKPMVTDSDAIHFFLPGPNRDNDKRVSTAITKLLQRCI